METLDLSGLQGQQKQKHSAKVQQPGTSEADS